jgi:hypothetical protein
MGQVIRQGCGCRSMFASSHARCLRCATFAE